MEEDLKKPENDFKRKLRPLLLPVIDFNNAEERKEHFRNCMALLFEAKLTLRTKLKMKEAFYEVRDEVVFKAIPALYSTNQDTKPEEMHTDFVMDVEEIVIEWNSPPHLWNSDYEEFIKARQL